MSDPFKIFANTIQSSFRRVRRGQAEEQLKRPVAELIEALGTLSRKEVATTPEIVVDDGRPDIGVIVDELLCGFVELKAPLENIDPLLMRGRNRIQWEKFRNLPNLIYSNSREWRLYQDGCLITTVTFSREPKDVGEQAVALGDAAALRDLFIGFFTWEPIVPSKPQELARYLAPLTRILRDEVADAVHSGSENLIALFDEWREYLFATVNDEEFADAYAQTIVSALLLARIEGATRTSIAEAERALQDHNSLLARILRILTQDEVRADIRLGLSIIERSIECINVSDLQKQAGDPWLYFYEDFLHAYDPKLAKDAGVYYTPAQIVNCQISLVSDLLQFRFEKTYSFAHEGVTVIDPAVGTGTYLVAAVQHAMKVVEQEAGNQLSRAEVLVENLIGFELLVGPYAVAHLRLNRELISAAGGGEVDPFSRQALRVYLADTLESPSAPNEGILIPLSHRPLARERENARRIKADARVIVCMGNPPYDRQMEEGAARKGGWVRFGDQSQSIPIFEDFLAPARRAGEGANLRSIYNDYVYFWRWALWKVFESPSERGDMPGIVSFITGSSYLSGPGFVGMREYMRRSFDQLWIIDLGGDNLGTRREPNVFNIQTPVAVAIGVRGSTENGNPAQTYYHRIAGSRAEKLRQINAITRFADVDWQECPADWHAPFKPAAQGRYSTWPSLKQIFPWQHNGSQFVRTWPIAPTKEVLKARWIDLLSQDEAGRREALKETRDRTIEWISNRVNLPGSSGPAIIDLDEEADTPLIVRYAYRSFDRQWALFDGRLGDYLKPSIWAAHGPRQIYLSTLLNTPIGYGPSVTFASELPDLHHFRGSFGGKDLVPLYRDRKAATPNITTNLLSIISSDHEISRSPEDLISYVAAVLGTRNFSARFWNDMEVPGIRVPITKNRTIFDEAVEIGQKLILLQTFGARFQQSDKPARISRGQARVLRDIPAGLANYPERFSYDEDQSVIHVGEGLISYVSTEVWDFQISGYFVVDGWLKYRMLGGAGRQSSPLNDIGPSSWLPEMTDELLQLLWSVEAFVAMDHPALDLLNKVLESDCYRQDELPYPLRAETSEPSPHTDEGTLL